MKRRLICSSVMILGIASISGCGSGVDNRRETPISGINQQDQKTIIELRTQISELQALLAKAKDESDSALKIKIEQIIEQHNIELLVTLEKAKKEYENELKKALDEANKKGVENLQQKIAELENKHKAELQKCVDEKNQLQQKIAELENKHKAELQKHVDEKNQLMHNIVDLENKHRDELQKAVEEANRLNNNNSAKEKEELEKYYKDIIDNLNKKIELLKNEIEQLKQTCKSPTLDLSMLTPINCPNPSEMNSRIPLYFNNYLDTSSQRNNLPAYLQSSSALNPNLNRFDVKRSVTYLNRCLNADRAGNEFTENNVFFVEFFKHTSSTLADALIISLPTSIQRSIYRFSYPNNIVIRDNRNNQAPLEYTKNHRDSEVSTLTYSKFFEQQLTFGHNPELGKRTYFITNTFEFYTVNGRNEKIYRVQMTKKETNTYEKSKEIEICFYARNTNYKTLKSCFIQNF